MLLSDEVGKLAGDISATRLPDVSLVDYVRVYDVVDMPLGALADISGAGKPPKHE
ncbi:MAG TPA: hypothetical protein VFE47_02240 [Tepidisphaeraceae bacterium]|jgi:hypothetical protein|nr:hypothetical protein [Tepidisphaeraceae bacterium]